MGRPLTESGVITSATYLPFGPPTELKFANGTTQSFGYDTRYRMLQNELTKDGIPPGQGRLARYNYDYDPAGNITGIPDTQDSEYHRHFGYDDLKPPDHGEYRTGQEQPADRGDSSVGQRDVHLGRDGKHAIAEAGRGRERAG